MEADRTMEKLLTITELAYILRKSPKTVYMNWKKWAQEGRIKVLLIGGKPLFRESEVEKLIKSFEV